MALCPYVVVTTAGTAIADQVTADLGSGRQAVQLGLGLGNAAYAVGAVLAAQLTQRFQQRHVFLWSAPVTVAGSLLAWGAGDAVLFGVGRVLEGLAGGTMLIATLPMLITRFGVRVLPVSVGVVNLGMFGASALGPSVGGLVADAHGWRGLFLVVAAFEACAWLIALVAFGRNDPPDPARPVDRTALGLVVIVTVSTFIGTSMLTGRQWTSSLVWAPVATGLLALVALVVAEDRRESSLIPVRSLTTQLPVTGTLAAMIGGAVFVSAVELLQTELTEVAGRSAVAIAGLFAPAPVGAVVASVALAALFRTRYLPLLVVVGMSTLVVASALLLGLDADTSDGLVLLSTGLLGFGAGATVSPGLFLTGLGLPADQLGRAFAMVQLLRALATYAVGPVLVYVALSAGSTTVGVRTGLVVTTLLAAVGVLATLLVPLFSGARLRRPDLQAWLDGGQALPSPITGVHLRPGTGDEDAAPLVPRRRRRGQE
jgi:MFS family permease